jgi:hypothetical protein
MLRPSDMTCEVPRHVRGVVAFSALFFTAHFHNLLREAATRAQHDQVIN